MTGKEAAMRQAKSELNRSRICLRKRQPNVRQGLEAMLTAIWLMQSVASS